MYPLPKSFTLAVHTSKAYIKEFMGIYDIYFLFTLLIFVRFSLGRSGCTITPERLLICALSTQCMELRLFHNVPNYGCMFDTII